jgi:hypothetical protein
MQYLYLGIDPDRARRGARKIPTNATRSAGMLLRRLLQEAVVLYHLAGLIGSSQSLTSAQKPAVLFCSPQGADGGWVDLEYLKNLSQAEGISADLTTSWTLTPPHMNLSWSRLRQYNAIVLFGEPAGIIGSTFANQTAVPADEISFPALVQRFMAAGGGVLMMPTELNKYIQQFPTLITTLGATLPLEYIVETDPAKRSELPRMGQQGGAVAHTAAIAPHHPVTAGVRGLWYPTTKSFNGQMTGPLIVDNDTNWTVLVRGSPTSHTVPLNLTAWATSADPNPLPPHPYQVFNSLKWLCGASLYYKTEHLPRQARDNRKTQK